MSDMPNPKTSRASSVRFWLRPTYLAAIIAVFIIALTLYLTLYRIATPKGKPSLAPQPLYEGAAKKNVETKFAKKFVRHANPPAMWRPSILCWLMAGQAILRLLREKFWWLIFGRHGVRRAAERCHSWTHCKINLAASACACWQSRWIAATTKNRKNFLMN